MCPSFDGPPAPDPAEAARQPARHRGAAFSPPAVEQVTGLDRERS
jgi:hypothetical protein